MLSLFRPRSPLPHVPATAISTTDTLRDALKSLQDCLDPAQKAELEAIKAIPDAHAVAWFTHQLDQENAKRKSRCVAARISPLLESVQQFSGVVETFVSSHPQVAALVWGSVKLVLQIASNFTSYFDKLSALLMTIGKRCPKFQEYQNLYGSSTDLQKALCDFYSVIVRCCEQAVSAISRPGYTQLLKAMAGSFNSEFGPILSQVDKSSNEVNETIRLVEAKLSTAERHDQRSERDEAHKFRLESIADRKKREVTKADRMVQKQLERQRICQAYKLEQLSNFNNRIAYWKARTQRHGSSGQWLTRTDQFVQWAARSCSSVFWCTGKLGSGKTVMTAYVVESLSAKFSHSTEKLVYFFCQHDNDASVQVTTILQSLIRQLLDQDGGRFLANERNIDIVLDNLHDVALLEVLLSDIVNTLTSIVVVLDGIDECSTREMKLLLKTLRSLVLRPQSSLKLYLSGDDRITDLVKSFLSPDFVVSTQRSEAGADLKELTQQLVDARREDGDLVAGDPCLYQEITDTLCTASQGMILWVTFQLEELCAQKTDDSIRLTLNHLPKDIFETYNRLLPRIVEEGSVEICNRIFRYIAAAKRPSTLDELGEALAVKPCQPRFMPENLINDNRGIVRWCHGLVVLHDLDDALQFTHSSVREFFCSAETQRVVYQGFHFERIEAERKLGEICVTYLNFNEFKTQLVKSSASKPQALLDPVSMATHALSAGSPDIVVNTAISLMKARSKSTPATPQLPVMQTIDRVSHAATRNFQFYKYASEFWLSHSTEFSPEQDQSWTLFRILAEDRYHLLSGSSIAPRLWVWDMDTELNDLRDYIFTHRHKALFRHWLVRRAGDIDLPSTLALLLDRGCFPLIRYLFQTSIEQAEFSWQEALLSLNHEDLGVVLSKARTTWLGEWTSTERSKLLAIIIEPKHFSQATVTHANSALVQFGIDPFYAYNTQGKTMTLLERLIHDPNIDLLHVACKTMPSSGAGLERKIATHGRTALHVAAGTERSVAVEILLRSGAPVNATDDRGQTALHIAARRYCNDARIMEVLLEAGASQYLKDKTGKFALDYVTGEVKDSISRLIDTPYRRYG